MSVGERTREHVEQCLSGLQESFGSFSVNQTTVSVSGATYDRVRDRAGDDRIEALAAVRDGDGRRLYVSESDEAHLPGTVAPERDVVPRLRQVVAEATGVEVTVEGVSRARIAGICDEDDRDRETLYWLVVVFDCRPTAGAPAEGAEWRARSEPERVGLALR
jgi:hypothetical protein